MAAQTSKLIGERASTGISSLAEAVILQSISDIWNNTEHDEALRFINGGGLLSYASMAGMKPPEISLLRHIVYEAVIHTPAGRRQ